MSHEIVAALAEGGVPMVLCTVLQVKGSAPRHAGSMLLAGPEGLLLGSVGGGRGEAMVLAACREHLGRGVPVTLEIDMQGMEADGPAMVCGGTSRVLVEPAPEAAAYRAAHALLLRGERVLLVKDLDTDTAAVVDATGAWIHGVIPGANLRLAMQALESGHPALDAGIFYDPVLPPDKLLILGGGHVGRALAALAPGLGFQVTVGDDRPEYVEAGRFPAGTPTRCGTFTEIVAGYPFDPSTYVVIVTRGHLCDLEAVRAVLGKPYRYAGFMGSSRKTRLVMAQVAEESFPQDKVDALCAPIGLEIGAETPQELAVAIAGELIAVRRDAGWVAASIPARRARRGTP